MRKSLAIFGGSLFQDIKYEKGNFIPTSKQTVIELAKEYTIDNYSLQNMTIKRAKQLIYKLPIKKYNDCILALGEADLLNPVEFANDLNEIIDFLEENEIRPLFVSLPQEVMKNPLASKLQATIDSIAVEKNIDYIYEGKTSKLVSYMVVEPKDWTSAILSLC